MKINSSVDEQKEPPVKEVDVNQTETDNNNNNNNSNSNISNEVNTLPPPPSTTTSTTTTTTPPPKINYIIATYSGISKSREKYDDETTLVLQKHMKILCHSLKYTAHIKQVTLVIPRVKSNFYSNYYDIGIYVSIIKKLNIDVVILNSNIPFGSSYSQYLYAYSQFPDFDHYIVMEDDWVPFPNTLSFDKLLLEEYEKVNFEGFLSAWVTSYSNLPLHSAISVGIISKDSFKKTYNNITNNEFNFDRSDITQYDFSNFFTNNDYSDSGKKYMIPFWETTHGVIYEYATHLSPNYLLVPIQLLQLNKYKYIIGNYTVRDKEKPNFDIKLLSLNIHNVFKANAECNEVTLKQDRMNKEADRHRREERNRQEERKRQEERMEERQREVKRQIMEERQMLIDRTYLYKLNVYKISSNSEKRMEKKIILINNKK